MQIRQRQINCSPKARRCRSISTALKLFVCSSNRFTSKSVLCVNWTDLSFEPALRLKKNGKCSFYQCLTWDQKGEVDGFIQWLI